jgi:hypothetical protein
LRGVVNGGCKQVKLAHHMASREMNFEDIIGW